MSISDKRLNQLVENKQWYHQRFDGSPMFLFAVGEAETKKEKRKPAGTEAKARACFFSHGKADWYLDMKDVRRGANAIIALAKRDPDISSKLLKRWEKDEKRFETFFWKEFPAIDIASLSDAKLVTLWKQYYKLFIQRFTSSSIIDHFALGTDEIVNRTLGEEVVAQKKDMTSSEFGELFSVATAPIEQSFINTAEIDLLKIMTKQSNMTLEQYQRKYFWIKNNYVDAHIVSIAEFKKDILSWKESGKSLKQALWHIKETPRLNKQKKARLFKQYKFSQLLRTLIKISDDFSWWQDERKKSTYFNIHIGMQMLEEIARRKGYGVEELKYAVAREIPAIVRSKTPNRKTLQARMNNSFLVATEREYDIRTGAEVEHIRKRMLASEDLSDIQDIRGLSASLGRVIGTARVLGSAKEVANVRQGDILIAVMTRPDYVPAMRRAAAIVTNEGGITSHAAIVSRELGIPCVIGTKIATKVFKDGDRVEVDANHGWIRKL